MLLLDARGAALNAKANVPAGMHPGPVMVPVKLQPGDAVRSGLRWVSVNVYDNGVCADIAAVEVKLVSGKLTAPLTSHVCGEAGKPMGFDEPWLQPPGNTR